MAWWYELRGAENRLVEMRRGFATEKEAQEAADRARRMMRSLAYPRQTEDLTVVTGADEKPKAKWKADHLLTASTPNSGDRQSH
jgi:hypothetical protein